MQKYSQKLNSTNNTYIKTFNTSIVKTITLDNKSSFGTSNLYISISSITIFNINIFGTTTTNVSTPSTSIYITSIASSSIFGITSPFIIKTLNTNISNLRSYNKTIKLNIDISNTSTYGINILGKTISGISSPHISIFVLNKYGSSQSTTHSENVNIISLLDKFDAFTSGGTDAKLSQYFISRKKEIDKTTLKRYY